MAEPNSQSSLEGIRTNILRRYYEVQFGRTAPHASAFEGATFDEYLRLLRVSYPGISAHEAAMRSKNPEFRALEGKLPREGEGGPAHPAKKARRSVLDRKESLDLAESCPAPDVEWLQLDRLKAVSGWGRLRDLADLRHLTVLYCGTPESYDRGPTVALGNLDVTECTRQATRLLLQLTRPDRLNVAFLDDPAFDLRWLEGHSGLRSLHVTCGLATGAGALEGLPLEQLGLSRVPMDDAFLRALASLRNLTALRLPEQDSFPPDELPDLPRLERIAVPAHPEHRRAWIDWAVARPGVACSFPPPRGPSAKLPRARMAGVRHGAEILEMTLPRKTWYEAWGDFASRVPGASRGDNHALRDRLKGALARLKPKVELSSEADELRISSPSLASVEACLDAMFGKAG
jgi:hypothetical protein